MTTDFSQSPRSQFAGFDTPRQNWFKMPNDWTDITAAINSIAELKVVEYVLKHTWGYQEYGMRKRITNDEFMHGRRRKDGTRIDKGTGLTKKSVIAGVKSALERGLLIEQVDDSDKARIKKYYSLRMAPEVDAELAVEHDHDEPPIKKNEVEKVGVKKGNAGVYFLHPEVEKVYPWSIESIPRTEQDTLERNLKQETKSNNNSDAELADPNVVVVALAQQGIADKVARQLATRYSQARNFEKIEYLNYLRDYDPEKVKNPQGWLRTAIEQDYAAPDGYKSAAQRLAEAAEETRRAEEMQQMFEREQRRQAEERASRRQAGDERLAQLQAEYGTTQHELDLWRQILAELRISMPSASFHAYMANTVLLSLTNGEALIGLTNVAARDWVENRLAKQIQRILATHLGGQKITAKFTNILSTTDSSDGTSP